MPELPEVETIARSLRGTHDLAISRSAHPNGPLGVLGRKFADVQVAWQRSIAEPAAAAFCMRLYGQSILEITRRGKFLVFQLEKDWMLIHLRMSGDLRVEPRDENPPGLHDRIIFNFADDARMVFNDTRKFGRAWLLKDPQQVLGNLGPEPFDPELTAGVFHRMLNEKKRAIKPLLMDQKFLAGMGNIYTDEALHLARVHPLEKASSLNYSQAESLLRAIREVLTEGIRRNGASIDWAYRGGDSRITSGCISAMARNAPCAATISNESWSASGGLIFVLLASCWKKAKKTLL
ncbi:MAG TPA: DNA-formamidopyrimidine glycosylase [Anaerolineaceae bacterium]|nr:DNA-formamidopyrimidine glycosylase [Anaerolineaceae bacterium]